MGTGIKGSKEGCSTTERSAGQGQETGGKAGRLGWAGEAQGGGWRLCRAQLS